MACHLPRRGCEACCPSRLGSALAPRLPLALHAPFFAIVADRTTRSCRVRMRSHIGPIHEMDCPVQLSSRIGLPLEVSEDALPDTVHLIAPETAIDRLPWPVACRQVSPGRASAQNPENPIENSTMVARRTAGRRAL